MSEFTPQRLADAFDYLDNLRESGITNMFGAAPYIRDAFAIHIDEARLILKMWMKSDRSFPLKDRVATAMESQ